MDCIDSYHNGIIVGFAFGIGLTCAALLALSKCLNYLDRRRAERIRRIMQDVG